MYTPNLWFAVTNIIKKHSEQLCNCSNPTHSKKHPKQLSNCSNTTELITLIADINKSCGDSIEFLEDIREIRKNFMWRIESETNM